MSMASHGRPAAVSSPSTALSPLLSPDVTLSEYQVSMSNRYRCRQPAPGRVTTGPGASPGAAENHPGQQAGAPSRPADRAARGRPARDRPARDRPARDRAPDEGPA